jgi:hypothetical protein
MVCAIAAKEGTTTAVKFPSHPSFLFLFLSLSLSLSISIFASFKFPRGFSFVPRPSSSSSSSSFSSSLLSPPHPLTALSPDSLVNKKRLHSQHHPPRPRISLSRYCLEKASIILQLTSPGLVSRYESFPIVHSEWNAVCGLPTRLHRGWNNMLSLPWKPA